MVSTVSERVLDRGEAQRTIRGGYLERHDAASACGTCDAKRIVCHSGSDTGAGGSVARISAVVHGVAVADSIVIARYESQIRMRRIHTRVDDSDDDRGGAVALGLIPGKLHIGVITDRTDARSGMTAPRIHRKLGSIVMTPVVSVICIVGYCRRIGVELRDRLFDEAVVLERSEGIQDGACAVEPDEEPAVEPRLLLPGFVVDLAVSTDYRLATVDRHKLVEFIDPEIAPFGI